MLRKLVRIAGLAAVDCDKCSWDPCFWQRQTHIGRVGRRADSAPIFLPKKTALLLLRCFLECHTHGPKINSASRCRNH